MRKKLFLILLIVLILPSILAININIEQLSSNNVLIREIQTQTTFNLKITNMGPSDNFRFYNLIGFEMEPKEISINQGKTKEITLKIWPLGDLNNKGNYIFKYFIRGQNKSEIEERLTMQIIDLEDAFEVGAEEFDPSANSLNVFIHNKVNFDFNKIDVEFKSPFFNFEESFALDSNEKKSFEIQLNKEEFKKIMAGYYTLNAKVTAETKKANIEGTLKFVEKNILSSTENTYGIIVNKKTIEKINEGNVIEKTETVLKKNIISRLFTNFNIAPDFIERKGIFVYYTWTREINPGETLKIVATTNWLFPFLVVFFIVAIVILAKQYSKTNLVLKKKVRFVKAKGGEFALKVSIMVNAKKYVEKVKLIDKLPLLVKLHQRFGGEQPMRASEKSRRIEWEFDRLEEGEHRVVSYIIYSKIGILGRFALPTATAIFERDGKVHETQSNRAFFVTEQGQKRIED